MKSRLGLRDIVLAARAVLAEGGVPALTMAAVAGRLGVTPMALYRHVDGREELLAAVADSVLEDVGAAAAAPGLPWWDAVESWMRDVRHRIVESPWTAQLIGTPTQIAPAWVAALDRLLAALERAPLDDAARAASLTWIARTTVGVVLLEAKSPLAHAGRAVGAPLEAALETASPEMAARWARIERPLERYGDDHLFEDLVRQTRSRLHAAARFEKRGPVPAVRVDPVDPVDHVDPVDRDVPEGPGASGCSRAPGDLTDAQWRLIRPLLPPADHRGAAPADDRRVLDGLRYRERTGASWRDIPARYGRWQTLYGRHRKWATDGTWARIGEMLTERE